MLSQWLPRVCLVCCLLCIPGIICQTYENATALKTALLTGYDPWLMPKNNQSASMTVSISFMLFNILEMDVVGGYISSIGGVQTEWQDERIVWSSASHGGLTKIQIQKESVWTPIMGMTTSLELEEVGEKWMKVTYQSTGAASWLVSSGFKASCSFNVRYWPFDKQICYQSFYIYNERPDDIVIQTSQGAADLAYFQPNAEWDLEGSFAFNALYPFTSEVNYGLKLKRQSTFYVLTIILPLLSLNLMIALVYLIPTEHGDRVGFNITLILSIVVFLILIGDHVPKTSDPMPLIGAFMMMIVGSAILSLITVIFGINIYFREGKVPDSSWGTKLVTLVNRCYCCCKRYKNTDLHEKTEGQPQEGMHVKSRSNTKIGFSTKVGVTDVAVLPHKSKTPTPETEEDLLTWKDVSKALDKVLLVFFLIITAVPSLVFPVYMSAASTYPDGS